MTAHTSQCLQIANVDISYGKTQIIHQVNFALQEGDIGCFLGPSGCGKTTLLLAIAGFVQPSSGSIRINYQTVVNEQTNVAPEKRQVGMVFQDYALFPNLTVGDNIRFGISRQPEESQRARLAELLDLVGMTESVDMYPHQLSGGQQQRVALARALAPKPGLLLLDEPFSNLDVELREQLAHEVRSILRQEGISAILVTHDQQEAFAMADEVCVMNQGRIVQQASADTLYHDPANQFVANFIGEGVFLPATIKPESILDTPLGEFTHKSAAHFPVSDPVDLMVRPEHVIISEDGELSARIVDKVFRGPHYLYTLEFNDGYRLLSLVSSSMDYRNGTEVTVSLQLDRIALIGGIEEP